jgi:hypothetical protein
MNFWFTYTALLLIMRAYPESSILHAHLTAVSLSRQRNYLLPQLVKALSIGRLLWLLRVVVALHHRLPVASPLHYLLLFQVPSRHRGQTVG